MQLPTMRSDTQGRGLATGFDHELKYVSRMTSNVGGINGNSWVVRSLTYLWFGNITVDGKPEEVTMVHGLSTTWLWQSGAYAGKNGTRRILTVLGNGDYRVSGPTGEVWVYYGPNAVTALRGRLKSETASDGIVSLASYNLDQRLESLTRTDPVSGESAALLYTYATSGVHAGLIFNVEKRLIRAGVEHPIRRWIFSYYDGVEPGGSLNDLKISTEQVWEEFSGNWARTSRKCYRYYTADDSYGFKHGLRWFVDSDAWDRMEALGLDPLDLANDSILFHYATARYTYDSDHRVTSSLLHAGTQLYEFDRMNSDDASGRNWWRRTIETRPDGATVTTYVNRSNDPVLKILSKDGESWPEYWEYNSEFRETLHATSSAIASFTEPSTASQNFTVTLKASAGLIETKEYYPTSGGGAGSAPGYIKLTNVKEGSSGTAIKQREVTYVARTVGTDTIYKTADSKVYRDTAGGGSNPATTSNTYTWRGATFAVLQHTVTPPVVGTGENGTGATTSRVTVYDDFGNAQWRKNERGRIDYAVHDRLTGALRFRIDDADTSLLDGVPAGWTTASGFGSSRRTDCQSDLLGRATLVLGPAHLVPTKKESGAIEPVLTRQADYACYLDGVREIRTARGGSTSGGFYTLGTVTLRRLDFSNRELQSIEASRACECGPISPSEAFPQATWKRWRREFYNAANYRDESRVWHVIPMTGEGFENFNYYATRYGRDAMGRETSIYTPGGTIKRSILDARGLTTSTWIGTNDIGATTTDPAGGGTSGNNMVLVTTNIYDGGSSGGNGKLTSVVRPVDSNSANDRNDSFDYDFRDRLVGETRSDGMNTFLVRYTLDNLGRTTQTDSYHTSVSSANLTARSKSYFDARGRSFKNETYSVDPSTGAVGNALIAQRWRDPSGNSLKETFQGHEGFVKRTYDAFDRPLCRYTACNPSGGSNDNNPSADTVVEQIETIYNSAGRTIQSTEWQRFNDASGTGPLMGPLGPQPRAIRRFTCWWHDAIGREVASADYGTNGGTIITRPEIPPQTNAEILVTRTRHASTGEPGAVIDSMGRETRWSHDGLGREIEAIENFKSVSPPASDVNHTTRFSYHPSGGLETLIVVNDVTGDQVTRWVYGTTLTDSGIATGHLLRRKIYPQSDHTDSQYGNGNGGVAEQTEHTYNRQGEVVSTKDPNETVHVYDRDKAGRLIHDRVTSFAPGIDQTVKRISVTYETGRVLTSKVGSYDHANPGSGSVLNEVEFTYNGFGLLTKDRQSHGGAVIPGTTPEVAYGYADGTNNSSRRTSIAYPNGRVVNLGYGASNSITDNFSQVKTIAISGESGNKVEYTIAGLGRFVKINYPQPGLELSMVRPDEGSEGDSGDPYDGYDRFGRVQEMRWLNSSSSDLIDAWQWGYNEASIRTWKKCLLNISDNDEAYGYDGLNQVIRDAVGTLNTNRTAIGGIPDADENFSYDPAGNWLEYRKEVKGSVVLEQNRSTNKNNQLTEIDGSSALLSYDRAGNAEKTAPGPNGNWSEFYKQVWDAWNRLVEVRDKNGETVQTNTYDGLSRRITKESTGTVTHTYWSDRWKPLEERLGSAETAARSYLWGERPGHRDELILRDRDTDSNGVLDERLYATMDYFNGTSVLNTSGVVLERYTYSAFGIRRIMAADFSPRSTSNYSWDFGFHGQFIDIETGWYNYGYRYYIPMLGRWLSKDPIKELGGLNLYSYAYNQTINSVDAFGLVSSGDKKRNCSTLEKTHQIQIGSAELLQSGFSIFNASARGTVDISISGTECEVCCDGGNWLPISEGSISAGLNATINATIGANFRAGIPSGNLSGWFGLRGQASVVATGSGSIRKGGCDGDSSGRVCLNPSNSRLELIGGGEITAKLNKWRFEVAGATVSGGLTITDANLCFECSESGCEFAEVTGAAIEPDDALKVSVTLLGTSMTWDWRPW